MHSRPRWSTGATTCPAGCGYTGPHLGLHFRQSPFCAPSTKPHPIAKRERDTETVANLFANRVNGLVGQALLTAHVDKYIQMTDLDVMRVMLMECVALTMDFMESEYKLLDLSGPTAFALGTARKTFSTLPSVGTMIARETARYQGAIPRTLKTPGGDNKGAAFFDVHAVVTVMLQESAAVRQLAIKSSEEWKTGALYLSRPAVLSDVLHGSRFTDWFELCGKASEEEGMDLRIALQGWTDEMTPVDGLSQKARTRKYGAVLAALLNLPLSMRHYADHLLLLALYHSRYCKANGGLARLLTGIGADGTLYPDANNLACELDLGTHSPTIVLPNDTDPTQPDVSYRLRIFFLFISLDWLAAGDFGPFAGSVTARRPCPKCMWTAGCACSWMSAEDPRRATVVHSEHCLGLKPRTHTGVLETMAELRELGRNGPKTGTISQLYTYDPSLNQPSHFSVVLSCILFPGPNGYEAFKTNTGIFSEHSASEKILRDVVCDSTLDVMHIFLCGMTRYLFSWLTDILIPLQFSWAELNRSKNAYK